MLKLSSEHETDFRVTLFLAGFMGYDLETGIYMRQSHGSPAFGNPTRYFLGGIDRSDFREEQLAAWPAPPKLWRDQLPPHLSSPDDWPVITAYSDAEAVRKANVWMARNMPGTGYEVPAVYARVEGDLLTLTRSKKEGYEPFRVYDLESFLEYLAANGIERVKFDFYGRWPVNPVPVTKSSFARHAGEVYRMMPAWEAEAAEEEARERLREKARQSGERASKAEPTIRTTEPRKDAAVEVEHPRAPRLYSYLRVTGEREEVYAYVSHVFDSDTCTQCYEHMLYHLNGLDELPDGRVSAFLYKSLYAGD
jgi:hypothetical protein